MDPTDTLTSDGITARLGTVRVCRLVVVHGPSKGSAAVLSDQQVDVGRAGHVEGPLGLNDPEVSKRHARVEPSGGQWFVADAGSRNGTFVNGERCSRTPLRDGAVIRVGTSVLLFEDVELPAFAELEPEMPTLAGPSLAMQRVRAELKLVAPQQVPVLLLGESGVGKEVVAEELHRQSGRRGAFVPVNCAAIASELAESELFGHAAGAFTGANRRSEGLFVAAQGGTLFLDEVGEMPIDLQPKLLRALARGEIRPVGSAQATTVDVRIVAATNRDVQSAERDGTLRADLLARLMGWTLRIPPLRQRGEDVLAFARLFLERRGHRAGVTADAAEALLVHEWPYNVRELEHAMAVAVVRSGGQPLGREHLPAELTARLRDRAFAAPSPTAPAPIPIEAVIARDRIPTAEELVKVLKHFGGNMARVADYFRKDRRQVYRWAEKLGVDPDAHREL